jgi:drug/metabolite transporter (DMT)-like permease
MPIAAHKTSEHSRPTATIRALFDHPRPTLPADKRPHRPVLGVALKLTSLVLFAGMQTCVKYLGDDVPMGETIFLRGLIAVLALTLLARQTLGLQVLKTGNWQRHALRSLAGTFSMFCLFAALTMIPMAEVNAINYSAPMFVTLLAMLFLGERIHVFRWTALGIGLVGVLVIVGPHLTFGSGGHASGFLVALGAALFSALAMVFLRSMSGGEHAITITFYFMLTSTVCGLLTLPWGWLIPTAGQAFILLLLGLFGVGGQLLMTYSYRYAEASTIAPLDYTSLIISATVGYWLFAELPSPSLWWGAPLVVASGLIIFWREYRLQQTPVVVQPPSNSSTAAQ